MFYHQHQPLPNPSLNALWLVVPIATMSGLPIKKPLTFSHVHPVTGSLQLSGK